MCLVGVCGPQTLQSAQRRREPILDTQFLEDFLQMRTHSVVPDSKNLADYRATLTGGDPVKNLGLPLGKTEGRQGTGSIILSVHTPGGQRMIGRFPAFPR